MDDYTDEQLNILAERWLRRVYVARADDRQKRMGLSYVTAETDDLAREIVKFIRFLQA